eukprot:9267001-Heterocapsa_arctica.AAC.1
MGSSPCQATQCARVQQAGLKKPYAVVMSIGEENKHRKLLKGQRYKSAGVSGVVKRTSCAMGGLYKMGGNLSRQCSFLTNRNRCWSVQAPY